MASFWFNVASTRALSPRRSMMACTSLRLRSSRTGSISISEMVQSCSTGVSNMSLHRLRVKTMLPAPMKVILTMRKLTPFARLADRQATGPFPEQGQGRQLVAQRVNHARDPCHNTIQVGGDHEGEQRDAQD